MLAVLVDGGGANDLDLPARQGRLQDGGGVDGALGRAGANECVDLVDEQDVVLRLHDLVDHVLKALFELTAVFGAGHQRSHVQRPDLLVAQDLGHRSVGDELSEPLGNGSLANTRVAQDERVVLLAACQHLHNTLYLGVAANDRIQLALLGRLGEVAAVLFKHGTIHAGGAAHDVRSRTHICHGRAATRIGVLVHEAVDGVAHGIAGDAHAREGFHSHAVTFAHDAQQQVLGRNIGLAARDGLAVGALKHTLGTRGEGDVPAGHGLGLAAGNLAHDGHGLVIGHI